MDGDQGDSRALFSAAISLGGFCMADVYWKRR